MEWNRRGKDRPMRQPVRVRVLSGKKNVDNTRRDHRATPLIPKKKNMMMLCDTAQSNVVPVSALYRVLKLLFFVVVLAYSPHGRRGAIAPD